MDGIFCIHAVESCKSERKKNNNPVFITDDMIGKTGMVDSFDVSLSSSFIISSWWSSNWAKRRNYLPFLSYQSCHCLLNSPPVHYRCSSFRLRLRKATRTQMVGSAPSAKQCIDHQVPQYTEQKKGQTTNLKHPRSKREQQQDGGRPTRAMCIRTAWVGGWATTCQCNKENDDLLCTCAA